MKSIKTQTAALLFFALVSGGALASEIPDDPQAVVKTYNEAMDAFIKDSATLSAKLGSVKAAKDYDDKELRKQISGLISSLSDRLDLIEAIEGSGATKSFDSLVKKEEYQAAITGIRQQYMKRFDQPRVLLELASSAAVTKSDRTKRVIDVKGTVAFSLMSPTMNSNFGSIHSYDDIFPQAFSWHVPSEYEKGEIRRKAFQAGSEKEITDEEIEDIQKCVMRPDDQYKALKSMGKGTSVTFGCSVTSGYSAEGMSKYAKMIWREEIAKTNRIKNWRTRQDALRTEKCPDEGWNFFLNMQMDQNGLPILHSMPVPDDKDIEANLKNATDICDKKISGFTELVKKCYGTKTVDQMIDERTSKAIESGASKDLFTDPKEREELKARINAMVAKLQQNSDLAEAEKVKLLTKEVFSIVRPKIAEQVKKEIGETKKDEKPIDIKANPFFKNVEEVVDSNH